MTGQIANFRRNIREKLEAMQQFWKNVLQKYPFIGTAYAVFSWISLFVFLLGLIFLEDSRTMFVQFLWSFYVLLQFWLIGRSKTLPWKHYVAFFLVGAWLIVPFTNFAVHSVHFLVGGQTSDLWSTAVLTPIAEEVFKLIPVGVFLFLSRRASSLSLADYALIGGAVGAGFQFMEEMARRLTSGFLGYGNTMFGKSLQWDAFSLFPGYFEESFFPTRMTASHAAITALIVLGIGIAVRVRQKLHRFAYIIPAWLLVIGIIDHAVWNGQNGFPKWVLSIHDLLGNGYGTKPLLVTLLILAIAVDYWMLNRIREELPTLKGEPFFNPFSELWQLGRAFIIERYNFGYLLAFYRERRELGYTLLYGNDEARERVSSLQESVNKWYVPLIAASVLLIALTIAGWTTVWMSPDSACFACLFDSLQNWWDGLKWYEKGALVLGAFAMTVPFLGFWSAVGLATTAAGVAASGREIGDIVRHPGKLLSPEYALAAVVTVGLNRIPGGKIVSKKVLKTASGMKRYEITTGSGLTYRVTKGSRGELRSVFAKIEPHHIGKGTDTTDASRRYVRRLGRQTDDAGHGIGNNLGGPGGRRGENIFPQTPSVNRGQFRQFEQQIAKAVQRGDQVFVRVVPKYQGGSTRPYEILYQARINGKTISRVFPNP